MKKALWIFIFLFGGAAFLAGQIKYAAITLDGLPLAGKEVNLNWTMSSSYTAVETIQKNAIPVVAFVNEERVIKLNEKESRLAILETWLQAGAELGNGTFSNYKLDSVPSADWFIKDIEYGEKNTREKLDFYHLPLRYFRFPEMDLGSDPGRLDKANAFLKERGYTPVTATMCFDDEPFNTTYINAKIENDTAVVRYVGEAYLKYFKETLRHYETLSKDSFGRQISHIIALRTSEINNDFLGYLLYILWEKSYRFVTLEEALTDPLYKRKLPEKNKGGFFWRYAQEVENTPAPSPPEMIRALYKRQTY